MNSLCHKYIKMVPNGGILYLATDPDRAQGRYCHIRSEGNPDKFHDAQKLTTNGADLATKKAARNRVRGGAEITVS